MNTWSSRPPGRVDATGPRLDPIPKRGGGLRWMTRLDPVGDAEYRQAVAPLAGRIERALGPEVLAIRTRPTRGGWRLVSWEPARAAWRRTLREIIDGAPRDTLFAVTDVRDCYGSIAPQTIASVLGPEAERAVAFLERLQERGVHGLPIGPDASAVLANAVLSEMDRAVRSSGARHLRWVDDVVLWGSRADVGRALIVLEEVADAMGLALHERKTKVLAGSKEARAVALGDQDSSIIAAP